MLKQNLNHTSHITHHTSNKGITLIALIITIIVMLILVAVTINMAVNGGLFEKAGQAVGETENAVNKEQELSNGKIEIGGVLYDSIDDYINGIQSAVHNWTRTGDTFTCSHCNTTYEMGQVVDYTPDEAPSKTGKIESIKVASTRKTVIAMVKPEPNITTTITAEKSGLDKYYAKKGKYPAGANVDENGIQTIGAYDNTEWIVLGIEDTNKDGINETLLITTAYPEEDDLYFYGAAAYNNGPSEINRICEELYSNSEYGKARGMTIEDVNRTLNYTPKGGVYKDDSGFHELDGFNTTYKQYVTEIGKYATAEEFDKAVEDGNLVAPEQGKNVGEYPINGYFYAATGNVAVYSAEGIPPGMPILPGTTSTKAKEVVFGSSAGYNYWLASRSVWADRVVACFGSGAVVDGRAFPAIPAFSGDGYENVSYAGLRPVVSLRGKLPEKRIDNPM